ncbi:MAG: hypothetical protein J6X55_16890 [Victivallales bacterium]|nr:hypothetical protein [Victivallales bacterium]
MNPLLRKIFFWDEPARGAFLHATAMLAVPWCMSALLCFLMPFLMASPPLDGMEEFFWKWLILLLFFGMPVVGIIEAIATLSCLIRQRFLLKNRQDGATCRWSATFLSVTSGVCWLAAIAIVLMHGEFWTTYLVLAWAFALCGYACFGGWLKHFQNDLICKGVRLLWWMVAVVWTVALCLAIPAKIAANRNCADLEKRFGRPPTVEARDARIARECRIDADFWRKVREILARRKKVETGYGLLEEDDYVCVYDILEIFPGFKQLSPTEFDCYRRQLANFQELPALEMLFNDPPPLLLHEDYLRLEVYDSMHKFFRGEQWRLYFALTEKDMDTVMAVTQRFANLMETRTQMAKYSFAEANIGWSYDRFWFEFLEKLVASQLPTDGQLAEMKNLLQKREPSYQEAMEGNAYDFSIRFNEHFEMHFEDLKGEARPWIYPLFYLLRTVNGGYWETLTWSRRLTIPLGRLLLPQFFWFSANDQRIVFQVLSEFPDALPKAYSGSLSLAMDFHYDWLDNTYYGYRNVLARNRALRCAIDTLLKHRRTGAYPTSMPSALEDPYTGKPLKYRVGECWIFDYDKRKAVPIQAIQVWSVGPNETDDDGVNFDLQGDVRRRARRDDIRILLPLKQGNP